MMNLLHKIILLLLCSAILQADTFYQQKGYVNDYTKQLHTKTVHFLNKQLQSLEKEDGIVFVVVVVEELHQMSIQDLAQDFFAHWQIGHQFRDSGILLIVSLKEYESFIDLGYGISDAINEAQAQSICQNTINTLLQKNKVDDAILAGVGAVFEVLGKAFGEEGIRSTRSVYTTGFMLVFLLSIPLLYLLARFAPTKVFFLSPTIGFFTGLTQSFGLAIVLAALGAVMVIICYMLKHFLPQQLQTKSKRQGRK